MCFTGGGRYSDNRYSDISKWVMQWVRVRARVRVSLNVRVMVRVRVLARVRVRVWTIIVI